MAENLFGIDLKEAKIKKSDFEKYGYLDPESFSEDVWFSLEYSFLGQYGNVIVRFDKRKLSNRVNYTLRTSCK
ncbi:MAG TPA: hypothetical protein VIG61_06940 [Fusobacterium sp.]|uniref:hypothetical protein n=1 Tax=Fusobacterium sp. TaxID=68766 RepID=UPI002F4259C0